MEITGYEIMDKLEELREQANSLKARFIASIVQFSSEVVDDPMFVMQEYESVKLAETLLTELQCRYNLDVYVVYDSETISLHEAIKRNTLYRELTAMWKGASENKPASRLGAFSFLNDSMDKEKIYPERQISVQLCREEYEAVKKGYTDIKRIIRKANNTKLEVEDSYMDLF